MRVQNQAVVKARINWWSQEQ